MGEAFDSGVSQLMAGSIRGNHGIRGGCSPTELGELLGMDPTAITQNVKNRENQVCGVACDESGRTWLGFHQPLTQSYVGVQKLGQLEVLST